MLTLNRRRDEAIIIGDDIVITVVDIRGDKVRLGITAPRQVPIDREEIHRLKLRLAAEAERTAHHAD
jgi:carbon storage regulator